MSYTISDGSSTVTLDLDRNMKDKLVYNLQFFNTLGGNSGEYKLGEHREYELSVQYMTSSEALQLNDWWENLTDLTFTTDTGSSYNVRIDNKPAVTVNNFYFDQFQAGFKITVV